MNHTIDLDHYIGDIVYLITDEDQKPRIVTRILITPNGVMYYLSNGTSETCHYSIEISYNRNYKIN